MKADRKSIRRNIMNLMDCGYDIEYSESIRMVPVRDKKGQQVYDPKTGEKVMEENCIWSDFYLVRKFTDSELRLLIDGLLFPGISLIVSARNWLRRLKVCPATISAPE